MAWGTPVSATQLSHTTETNEKVFQISAADMEVELQPSEVMQLLIRANTTGTTDTMICRVYTSSVANPGAVPDSAQTLAGSDWAILTAFRIPPARDNEWQNVTVRSARWVSVTMTPTGATDSWTSDLTYSLGS